MKCHALPEGGGVSKGVVSIYGNFPKRHRFKKTLLSYEKVMFQKIISLSKTAPFRLISPTPPRYSECSGVGVGVPEGGPAGLDRAGP